MSVKLSKKALVYLKCVGDTTDASLPLKGSDVRAANELKKLNFVTYIARSQGGGDVALTQSGLDYYDSLNGQ